MDKKEYKEELYKLQVELVKLQRHIISHDLKILIIFEGRDAAGKDGTIKRITEHLSPRETRVVALGKPSDREQASWYFQRYAAHLPAEQEMTLFNRSWYNRAGVERVMGFCTDTEYEAFMGSVLPFEHLLVKSGVQLLKYYLDISKPEQIERLEDRRRNPLKTWKISPIDAVAVEKWDAYSAARDEMLRRTQNPVTPWHVVRADSKKRTRINVIRHIMASVDCPEKDLNCTHPDPDVVFRFEEKHLTNGAIAR